MTTVAAAPGSPAPHGAGSLWSTPIKALGLPDIEQTLLGPILKTFRAELAQVGIRRLQPHFYLSTEWGVAADSTAIAVPFYLARADLLALHAQHSGHVEGQDPEDILRYLRHEMGHVVNYGYKLYESPDWIRCFGAITQPYIEEYRPSPFSRRFVRHLPGWYAQKHPDEDWAETFAVWMTPRHDWRAEYAGWPEALAKLTYCATVMAQLGDQEPLVSAADTDEEVSELTTQLGELYGSDSASEDFPEGLDGALQTIFPSLLILGAGRPATALIDELRNELLTSIYRWTGHFPERSRPLLRHLRQRAEALQLGYQPQREREVIINLTTLVTALAMNHLQHGAYLP